MSESITFEGILRTLNKAKVKFGDIPTKLRLSQKTFNDLYDLALEDIEGVEIDKTQDRPVDPKARVFGVNIEIDEAMKYGYWRFER